jgi:hypothetical protein
VVNVTKLVKRRLTDILLEEGLLKEEVLQEALNRQRTSGEPLPTVLQHMGVLAEIDLARALAKQYSLPYIDPSKYKIPRDVMDAIPLETLRQHQFVPFDKIGRCMLLAIANVPAIEILESLERHTGSLFFIYVGTVTQVQTALRNIEEGLKTKQVPRPVAVVPAIPTPTAALVRPAAPVPTRPGAPTNPAVKPAGTTVTQKPGGGLPSPLASAPPPSKPASSLGR